MPESISMIAPQECEPKGNSYTCQNYYLRKSGKVKIKTWKEKRSYNGAARAQVMGGGIGEGIPSPRLSGNKSFHFSLGNHFLPIMVRGIQVTLPPHVVPGMIHGIRPGQTENQESTRRYSRILTSMSGEAQLFPLQLPRGQAVTLE